MPLLTREFFARPCQEVARNLLGCLLVRRDPAHGSRVGRIVEVEAYLGNGADPASHSHRGTTPRNRVMFGPPGRFYIYLCMGIHICSNLVCEPEGTGAAVLLRAIEPLQGLEPMRAARGGRDGPALANGPGKLSQAFGIGLEHNGRSALRGSLRIEAPPAAPRPRILRSPRIGISAATELPLRFFVAGNRYVSRSRVNHGARS